MLAFPSSPTIDQIYSSGDRSWYWNGETWNVVSSLEGLVISTEVETIVVLTQSEYDALTPDPTTLYVITP